MTDDRYAVTWPTERLDEREISAGMIEQEIKATVARILTERGIVDGDRRRAIYIRVLRRIAAGA